MGICRRCPYKGISQWGFAEDVPKKGEDVPTKGYLKVSEAAVRTCFTK